MEEILKKLLEGQICITDRSDSMEDKLGSMENRLDSVDNRLDFLESGQKEIYGMLRGWEESKSFFNNL